MTSHVPSVWVDPQPGRELAIALEGIDGGVLRELGDSSLVDVVVAAQRQVAHLQAVQVRAMVELSRRETYAFCGGCDDSDETVLGHEHSPVRAVGSEFSAALSWTPRFADQRAALAIEMVEELPDTLIALDHGRIDMRRAQLIADKTRVLSPAVRYEVECRVLPTAGDRTFTQLARALDRQVIAADPAAAERRRQQGRAERRVDPPRPVGEGDGIADMVLTGPAEDVMAFYTAIDAAARHARRAGKAGGDTRTLDQHRFDIVTGLGWNALSLGHVGCCAQDCAGDAPRVGTRHGRPAVVQVTVPVTTLAGADDQPAYLDGYGPIPAQAARMIAADATLRRLLTDPADGALLEYGRTTYTPPPALAEFVIARDRTCRFPTATMPAWSCDIDHRIPYQRGGTTGALNNQALCRRFHIDKTLHGWKLRRSSRGEFIWISPIGRVYRTPPEPIGPIHDEQPTDDHRASGSQRPADVHRASGSQRPADVHRASGSQRPADVHRASGSQRPADDQKVKPVREPPDTPPF